MTLLLPTTIGTPASAAKKTNAFGSKQQHKLDTCKIGAVVDTLVPTMAFVFFDIIEKMNHHLPVPPLQLDPSNYKLNAKHTSGSQAARWMDFQLLLIPHHKTENGTAGTLFTFTVYPHCQYNTCPWINKTDQHHSKRPTLYLQPHQSSSSPSNANEYG